jgi:hypothetical protein
VHVAVTPVLADLHWPHFKQQKTGKAARHVSKGVVNTAFIKKQRSKAVAASPSPSSASAFTTTTNNNRNSTHDTQVT